MKIINNKNYEHTPVKKLKKITKSSLKSQKKPEN